MHKEKVVTLEGSDTRIHDFLQIKKEKELNDYDPFADYLDSVDWDTLDVEGFFKKTLKVVCLFEGEELKGIVPIYPIDTNEYPYLKNDMEVSSFYYLSSETTDSWKLIMEHMLKFHKRVILDWEYTPCNLASYGYVASETFFEHGRYIYRYLRPIVHADYKNQIRDHYQSYYQKGEVHSFYTSIKNKKEMKSEIYREDFEPTLPIYLRDNGFDSFLGFTYFNANELRSDSDQVLYFSAYSVESKEGNTFEKLVGVLKLIVDEEYNVLSFIDVHFDYRRMGIAKRLYQELERFLKEDDVLISTRLSIEGQAAGLDKLRQSIIKKCPMYQTIDDYHEKHVFSHA